MDELMARLDALVAGIPGFWLIADVAAVAVGTLVLLWLAVIGPLRRRIRGLEAALEQARGSVATLGRNLAAAEVQAGRVPKLESRLSELTEKLMDARGELSATQGTLSAERLAHAARIEELRRMEEELSRSFDALAAGALDRNARAFLGLVSERFETHRTQAEAELRRRQEAISGLIAPLAENLGRIEAQIGALEKAREGAYAGLTAQVGQLAESQARLQGETARLVQALRAPKTRGRWGEVQLARVFEIAGMAEHVDFVTEAPLEGGALRPDAIVRLPGGRTLVVDAKTPLEGWLRAMEAGEETERVEAMAAHARQMRAHVRQLSAKAYWEALETTPDFVVMFVPGEAFYTAAAESDPGLYDAAVAARVLIATPMTLIALLKSVAHGWQQDRLARSALEVAEAARTLYDRLRTHGRHMAETGEALRRAVEGFNAGIGSLEGRVLPAARRFESLGLVPADRAIPAIAPLDVEPRGVTAPEFTDPDRG